MAGYRSTIAPDYQVDAADWGETVTVANDATSESVAKVSVAPISRHEVLVSNGWLTMQDSVFLLPAALMTITPVEGDKITRSSDSTAWRIRELRLLDTNQWRAIASKER